MYAYETTYAFCTGRVQLSDLILESSHVSLEFCYLIAQPDDDLEQFFIVESCAIGRVMHSTMFLCCGKGGRVVLFGGRAYPHARIGLSFENSTENGLCADLRHLHNWENS